MYNRARVYYSRRKQIDVRDDDVYLDRPRRTCILPLTC